MELVQRRLQESEARFRLVVEIAPNALIMVSASGVIEMINAQAERIFGYSREELIGQRVEMLLPERFWSQQAELRDLFFDDPQRPAGLGRELYGLKKDGSEFPLEVVLNPMKTDAGMVTLAAIADLTERNQTMLETAYLAAIVESSDDAVIGKDLAGIIKSWNGGAQQIFGYEAPDIIGRHISVLFPPDRLSEETMIVEMIRRGERVEHHETIRRRKNGTDIPVSLSVSPIRDPYGNVIGASKIIRDFTERHEAQRKLALNEAEFRASFEAAAVGKVMAEPSSRRILRANHAFASMLGYTPDELVDRSTLDVIWPADRAADMAEYANLISGEAKAFIREQRYVHRDGTPLWVRVSATLALVSGDSQPTLVVIAVENIDEHYRAQAQLLEAKHELEKVVRERSEALNDRNLLLREVYHRVKNNLQMIDALLMMQAQTIDDPRAKVAMLNLRGRIFAMGLVHQQLMGASDLKTFDVAPFLSELSKNIIEGGADDSITLWVDALPLEVGLDFAVPLGLLVTELVTNSLKHAFPDSTGSISVILRPNADEELMLIVSDDGQGHRRSEAAEPMKTGLGTSIVNSLTGQLEGTLTVRTGSNGTTTEIRIPMPIL